MMFGIFVVIGDGKKLIILTQTMTLKCTDVSVYLYYYTAPDRVGDTW